MSRSLKKGPFVDERVLRKVAGKSPSDRTVIKTWSRACTITPEMLGFTFGVHNGKDFVSVHVTEEMVGHRLGEFSPTRKFTRHGGKMQKDLEVAAKQRELDAAKATKASSAVKKK
jgi:small subunit ribosomal protein S19